jgi:hypothetical protein
MEALERTLLAELGHPIRTPTTKPTHHQLKQKGFRVIAMSEDRSSNGQKSWLGKLTQAFAR